ncbi:MAG: 50S ribosomal protein L3 [Clostridiales bacterium]|nr:50S ribosomal protein L3 [Clostridiales bacterium]MCD7945499.1 50S ribosomal protein L3 [Clostridiales bacterium]
MEKKAILGKKVGMTQIFDEAGKVIPVTVIEAGPCTVVQKKTAEKDGYEAVQLGFQPTTEKHLTKGQKGHLAKAGVSEMLRVLKEVDVDSYDQLSVGDVLKADVFEVGDKVDAVGISKGKGYAGVIKRHGAQRTPMSHGGGPVHRHAGSMGSTSTPSRIRKGKIGAGQMGNEQVTIQNLEIVQVDPEINLLAVKGAIPGPKGGVVVIKSTSKVNVAKKGDAGISSNPQKASARVNPQKASARKH